MSEINITLNSLRRSFDASSVGEIHSPVHPGEILREEFMAPFSLSAISVAKACNLPRSRIERIVKGEIGISTDTALQLSRLFRTTSQFWLNMQTRFESEILMREIGSELDAIQPIPMPQAA